MVHKRSKLGHVARTLLCRSQVRLTSHDEASGTKKPDIEDLQVWSHGMSRKSRLKSRPWQPLRTGPQPELHARNNWQAMYWIGLNYHEKRFLFVVYDTIIAYACRVTPGEKVQTVLIGAQNPTKSKSMLLNSLLQQDCGSQGFLARPSASLSPPAARPHAVAESNTTRTQGGCFHKLRVLFEGVLAIMALHSLASIVLTLA